MRLFTAGLGGLAIASIVFGAASTSLAPARWFTALYTTATENAYVQGDVTPISPKISGYIREVAVVDNQTVRAGDILLRIDDTDYRARVAQASATVEMRRAVLENLASRIELQHAVVEQAAAAQLGAEADAYHADQEYSRVHELLSGGWLSQAKLDQAEADHLRAHAKVAEAKANVSAAVRQTDVLNSLRPQLEADIDAAVAALRLAEIDLADTVVRAPTDGRVGERRVRVGQYVRPGTLLLAVVPHHVWVVANFKETQIAGMQDGDSVAISVDAVSSVEFTGWIESISPASGAQFAVLPPDNATGNFTRIVQRIPVKITFNAGQPGIEQLRPGMSAVVALVPARSRPQETTSNLFRPLRLPRP
jgi:membrane fusion protein (multidrug efflux system)